MGDNADQCDDQSGPASNNGCPEEQEPSDDEAPNTYMASASSCDDLNSPEPTGEIETSFTNTDDETDQSVELSVRLVNEFYGAGDSQSFGSVEDGATSKTITLQGAVVGVNTIEFLDTAGQVVHEEQVFVDACEFTEPEMGDLKVNGGCGFVLVTNEEDADAEFLYGSFDKASPDGQVSVPAGKTVKVETSRRQLDYLAFFDNGKFAEGENVSVKQDCGGNNPGGPDQPNGPNNPGTSGSPSNPGSSNPPTWHQPTVSTTGGGTPSSGTNTPGFADTGAPAPSSTDKGWLLVLLGSSGLVAVAVFRRRVVN